MLPGPSISAEGRPSPLRRPPAMVCALTVPIVLTEPQLTPPLVEVKASIEAPLVENGTTTVPLGCTSGCPPSPDGEPDGWAGADQVSPPSVDVDMISVLAEALMSNSVEQLP